MDNSHNDHSDFWKQVCFWQTGFMVGLLLAWFTAFTTHGVNQTDMEKYVKDYSPYVLDRSAISEHQQTQDREIARLGGVQSQVVERLGRLEKGGTSHGP